MGNSLSIPVLLLIALLAANFPFFSSRWFGVTQRGRKTLGIRLLELLAFYFLVGGLGLLLEKNAGQIAPQGWEFYAITATLFLTFAFPGFVYRYLLKQHD
ncbi:DUF2818 family protein [Rhodoferax bucti]|uniref:DUF2818 family protein n=1 Tax=Rhodoferax bucti TaxID=2576305 RepID=UPI00110A00C2|nr:DUF2818 family protein [Rhodoferax bucti]